MAQSAARSTGFTARSTRLQLGSDSADSVQLGELTLFLQQASGGAWRNSIWSKVNSTYFGYQGYTLLIFTFPGLFAAVLGCFYLHLLNNSKDNYNKLQSVSGSKKRRLGSYWKRPMLVKGPLGIVSATELAFLAMFIAFLVWYVAVYLRNMFGFITSQSAAIDHAKVWEVKLETTALVLGLGGNVCLALLYFPVTRGSSVLPLFGLTSESSIKYHIWLGHLVMFFFTAHGIGYFIYWALTNQMSKILEWSQAGISNVAGELSLLAGLVLWATTFPRIRKKAFELFFYTHYLYILFMLFFFFHVGIYFACTMLPGFYLFFIDRYLRFLQSRPSVRFVSARILPCQTLELNFAKSPCLAYSPTSILFVNVPSISKLQWHPFTVNSSSNMEPEILSVVIKSEGSWTRNLYEMLSSSSVPDRLDVSVEGPYGPTSTDFLRHETLVMVSGGSGITPFISIIRELMYARTELKSRVPKVILISAFKYSSDLTMLDLIFPLSETKTAPSISSLQLKIKAFVTREKEPKTNEKNPIRSIWLNPFATDSPISSILGPKYSWLWLSAIIASSFVMFLIFIALITRYYIYPIDHNTDEIFSLPLRVFLSLLVMCFCVSVTASVAVFWNKKLYAKESKQKQTMEMSIQAVSSDSYNGERELESLPLQSLASVTQIHYGERPDLKKLLSECKGSSVGVLVCGPKKLRHDVASICSSGSMENLQFESISFSW